MNLVFHLIDAASHDRLIACHHTRHDGLIDFLQFLIAVALIGKGDTVGVFQQREDLLLAPLPCFIFCDRHRHVAHAAVGTPYAADIVGVTLISAPSLVQITHGDVFAFSRPLCRSTIGRHIQRWAVRCCVVFRYAADDQYVRRCRTARQFFRNGTFHRSQCCAAPCHKASQSQKNRQKSLHKQPPPKIIRSFPMAF